eukprot:SAG31_NODE_40998_length_278_cov_0.581006_1_plen_55_part_01
MNKSRTCGRHLERGEPAPILLTLLEHLQELGKVLGVQEHIAPLMAKHSLFPRRAQ